MRQNYTVEPYTETSTTTLQLVLNGFEVNPPQGLCHKTVTPDSTIQPRVLKVQEVGDFWRKRTMPVIRLQGKWMLQAGVQPNSYVQVTNPYPGVLLVTLLQSNPQNQGEKS
jgi:hypothetical protein